MLLMLVSTYVRVLRKHNFLDIGARGEQDFTEGVPPGRLRRFGLI